MNQNTWSLGCLHALWPRAKRVGEGGFSLHLEPSCKLLGFPCGEPALCQEEGVQTGRGGGGRPGAQG